MAWLVPRATDEADTERLISGALEVRDVGIDDPAVTSVKQLLLPAYPPLQACHTSTIWGPQPPATTTEGGEGAGRRRDGAQRARAVDLPSRAVSGMTGRP